MNTKVETITPSMAAEWLKKNTLNRRVRTSLVNYYANEMKNENWKLTNQGIAFTKCGKLADGQHRLMAVVQSGITVQMNVTRDMDSDAMGYIDGGSKRTSADYMHLHLQVENAVQMAAACRQVVNIFMNFQNFNVSNETLKFVFDNYGDDIKASFLINRSGFSYKGAWLNATLAIARKFHRPSIDALITGVSSGENLRTGMPAFFLRNWLIHKKAKALNENYAKDRVFITMNACLAELQGDTMFAQRVSDKGIQYFFNKNRMFANVLREDLKDLIT